MVACTVTGGRSRSKIDLATVDARLASTSDDSGAAANSARDPRRHNQMPMISADDRQRHECSDRAHHLRHADRPVRAVIDEPGQHRLVVGDEATAVEDVFRDQHEERQVGGHQRGSDGHCSAGRGDFGIERHAALSLLVADLNPASSTPSPANSTSTSPSRYRRALRCSDRRVIRRLGRVAFGRSVGRSVGRSRPLFERCALQH